MGVGEGENGGEGEWGRGRMGERAKERVPEALMFPLTLFSFPDTPAR